MKLRTPATIAGAAALAVTAGLMTAAPQASSAAPTKSFAYGLSINGEGKQPYVESTDGSTQSTPNAVIPDNPRVSGTVLNLTAGDDAASVTVGDLTVGSAADQLPPEVKKGIGQLTELCTQAVTPAAEQGLKPILDGIRENAPTDLELPSDQDVIDFCNGLLDAEIPALASVTTLDVQCNGDSGTVTVAGVEVLGAPVPLAGEMAPDTKLFSGQAAPLEQAVQVTFNRQTAKPDGTFSVDGVVVSLGGGQGEIVLGHTTCGEPLAEVKGVEETRRAPAPEAVRQSVPVTG